jgi:hypothetical protein
VRGLLRQSVKAVARADGQHDGGNEKPRYNFLFNADSLDSGFGSGRVGNNKSVKPVVSGHFELLLLRRCLEVGAALDNERHKLAKSDLRELRKSFGYC